MNTDEIISEIGKRYNPLDFVLPEHREKGVARTLIETSLHLLKEFINGIWLALNLGEPQERSYNYIAFDI